MIKLKISYENRAELARVLQLLKGDIKRLKEPKSQEGRFKKAYIELKDNLEK